MKRSFVVKGCIPYGVTSGPLLVDTGASWQEEGLAGQKQTEADFFFFITLKPRVE